jgi:transposase
MFAMTYSAVWSFEYVQIHRGEDRQQVILLPECLGDYITEDNKVRVVDSFVNELDMVVLDFEGANPF